ncbi:M-phase inducer phosphatase-like [Haliotis rufescens]|uniref:M-phase inducer phosphatase-like n=1 Tax=Haliotis rufescens TaxID=6454 RepID=UPI00201F65A8|nr:M-phase inducer phosphatase-like [Haliotis rufescens]
MTRRKLTFAPAIEVDATSQTQVSDESITDIMVSPSLTFDDSRDSGFESQESDNETSPVRGAHLPTSCNHGFGKCILSGNTSDDDIFNEVSFGESKSAKAEVTSETMKTAVDRMENLDDLIGDGSKICNLPTITGRHKDLKSVSPLTVSQLLEGKFDDVISGYQIIDCRYPYEYEGGHIEGSVNLHNEALITDLVTSLRGGECFQQNILVFHCEFSSERGPKLLRHLRNLDRMLNSDRYPFLFYPEVYLLDGGYKAFYEQHQVQCQPRNYLPMLHQDYAKELSHFRVKTKSLKAGKKQSMHSRRHHMNLSPIKFSSL